MTQAMVGHLSTGRRPSGATMTIVSQQTENSAHGNEQFSKFLKQQNARSRFQKNKTSQVKSLDWQQNEELI